MSAARSSRSWDQGRNRTPAVANTPSRHGTPFRPHADRARIAPAMPRIDDDRGLRGCASAPGRGRRPGAPVLRLWRRHYLDGPPLPRPGRLLTAPCE